MEAKKRWIVSFAISILFLFVCGMISLSVGPAGILIFPSDAYEKSILFDIRLPRVLLGFAAGGGLSLSGLLLQGVFKNVLVEPYTLGISGGAALFVSFSVLLRLDEKLGSAGLSLAGFLGSLFVLLAILLISSRRYFRREELLLTGVMISFICSSFIMLLFALFRSEDVHKIIFWMMGTLQEDKKSLIFFLCAFSLLSLLISYIFCLDLNALQLGEEEASNLGIDVYRVKRILLCVSSILTGITVSITGIIGFVGLLVPHIMRLFYGTDHRFLLSLSFFFGSAFLILCDTISRTILEPAELPVGVITGIIGGFFFLFLLLGKNGK